MNAAKSLTGEDLAIYERALQLKDQSINQHRNKDKEKAMKLMLEAYDEIKKVVNNTDMKVVILKSKICQNIALFHKQSSELTKSLEMSILALETNP